MKTMNEMHPSLTSTKETNKVTFILEKFPNRHSAKKVGHAFLTLYKQFNIVADP